MAAAGCGEIASHDSSCLHMTWHGMAWLAYPSWHDVPWLDLTFPDLPPQNESAPQLRKSRPGLFLLAKET